MFDKYIYNFLMFVNHWSTYLTSWSWIKLYKNRVYINKKTVFDTWDCRYQKIRNYYILKSELAD